MAGGQERILRRRIKSVESTKKITRGDGAHRRDRASSRRRSAPPRRGPTASRSPRSSATSRPAVRGLSHPLLEQHAEPTRAAFVVDHIRPWSVRRLQQHRHPPGRARDRGRSRRRAATTTLFVVGKKAQTYFRFRGYRIEARFLGVTDQPTYEQARDDRGCRVRGGSSTASSTRSTSSTRGSCRPGSQEAVVRRFCPLDATARGPAARERRSAGRDRVRADRRQRSSTSCCRATSSPGSSRRCSTRRRPSTRPASGP